MPLSAAKLCSTLIFAGPALPVDMTRDFSLSQLTILVGGTIVLGGLLILLIYVLHKAFQRQRSEADLKPASPRAANEAAFALATVQSVIAGLKAREKELAKQLQEAEQRAEAAARTLESVGREIPLGLMLFSRDGFLALSNPAAHALLGIDTWSRRRYPELLQPESPLTQYIRECLETGKSQKRERFEYVTPEAQTRILEVCLSPWHDRKGQVAGVICLLAEVGASQGS
jgi:PAS domain-containing protein